MLPINFMTKYSELMSSAEAKTFFTAIEAQRVQVGLRLNPLKPAAHLDSKEACIPWSAEGYYAKLSGHSFLSRTGGAYSQEPSAQLPATLANVKPGDKVLDLCAAPGGKSTQLAGMLKGQGLLWSNEINGKRVNILTENLERWGARNVVVSQQSPSELAKRLPQFFDCVVVDAPCSGEGMFRKNDDATQYWTQEYVLDCQKRQRQILEAAYTLLKPGGRLVYSTCTYAPEEDEQNISWLLNQFKDLTLESHQAKLDQWQLSAGRPEWSNNDKRVLATLRIWPHLQGGEGHFAASLIKKNQDRPTKKKTKSKVVTPASLRPLTAIEKKVWQEFYTATFIPSLTTYFVDDVHFFMAGEQLYAVPPAIMTYSGPLKRWGLWCGTFKKNRFIPNHALIMSATIDDLRYTREVSAEQAQHYIHGEVLTAGPTIPNKQWVGVTFSNLTVGWGYCSQGQLKNFYPKAFRH